MATTASSSSQAACASIDQTVFAPILQLAPKGEKRAARAVEIFDRQLQFQRKFTFRPEIDPALERVMDELPPRQSTVIRAAALYGRRAIPWRTESDGTHQISVAAGPDTTGYRYQLASMHRSPETPEHFAGRIALRPANGAPTSTPASVIGTLRAELLLDTYDLGAIVDVVAAVLGQCYGAPQPPWDAAPGAFNHHDRTFLERLDREMPHVGRKLDEYVRVHNVLDQLPSSSGPITLYNLDVEARPEALRKYPRLAEFHRTVVSALAAQSSLLAADGSIWLRSGLERGRIQLTMMVRDGRLVPFSASLQPAGEGVALDDVDRGSYRSLASLRVTTLGMTFGLTNIGFTTTYQRDENAVAFGSRMNSVPELVAPPGIHKAMSLVAGTFLQVLATGQGGLAVEVTSQRLPGGVYRFGGSAAAELAYAPALGFLARIGDALADEHDAEVRAEERALGEEFFDAFLADYANARPAILAMDDGARP
jgi:hypothetical protein